LQPYDYLYNKSYIAEIPRILKRIGILLAERKEMTDQILRAINNKRISNLQTRTLERLQADDITYEPNIDPEMAKWMLEFLHLFSFKTPILVGKK
jgi:hypothetical protein